MKARTKLWIFRIVVLAVVAWITHYIFSNNILYIRSFVTGKNFVPFLVTFTVFVGGYFGFIVVGALIVELFRKAKRWKKIAKDERRK